MAKVTKVRGKARNKNQHFILVPVRTVVHHCMLLPPNHCAVISNLLLLNLKTNYVLHSTNIYLLPWELKDE